MIVFFSLLDLQLKPPVRQMDYLWHHKVDFSWTFSTLLILNCHLECLEYIEICRTCALCCVIEMKGTNFHRLKGKHLSVTLLVLTFTTIFLWAWEKNPFVTTLQEQFNFHTSGFASHFTFHMDINTFYLRVCMKAGINNWWYSLVTWLLDYLVFHFLKDRNSIMNMKYQRSSRWM